MADGNVIFDGDLSSKFEVAPKIETTKLSNFELRKVGRAASELWHAPKR
jgi:hypothetical protein